jgi:hypothetical protein
MVWLNLILGLAQSNSPPCATRREGAVMGNIRYYLCGSALLQCSILMALVSCPRFHS